MADNGSLRQQEREQARLRRREAARARVERRQQAAQQRRERRRARLDKDSVTHREGDDALETVTKQGGSLAKLGAILVIVVVLSFAAYGVSRALHGNSTQNSQNAPAAGQSAPEATQDANNPEVQTLKDLTQTGNLAMVEVAQDELQAETSKALAEQDRRVYNTFVGNAEDAPWSLPFAVFCANHCGFIEGGMFPRTASLDEFLQFFQNDASKGSVNAGDGSYLPQPGDIAVWQDSQRVGVVESVDEAAGTFSTIEGDLNGEIGRASYSINGGASLIVNPTYSGEEPAPAPADAGQTIILPEGLGDVDTFEGWSMITDPTSPEYQLRADAGESYNDEGFGIINGCYVVAVRPMYGSVGDYLTFTFADGSSINCIIGDVKGDDGIGVNEYGFYDGQNIIEFCVETGMWYSGHENPGTPSCHPEWGQYIVSCTNTGNFWGH